MIGLNGCGRGINDPISQNPAFWRKFDRLILPQNFLQLVDGRCEKFVFMVDQLKGAVPFQIFVVEDSKSLVSDLMRHESQRHDGQHFIIENRI